MFSDSNSDKYTMDIYLFFNLSNYYKLLQADAVTGKVFWQKPLTSLHRGKSAEACA